jgi:hypothetical protein
MTPNFIGQKNNRSRLRGASSLYRLDPVFLEHGNCLVNILLFLVMMLWRRSDFRFADAQEMLSYFERKETDS